MVRSRYSERVAVITECGGQGRTKQQFKEQCDVNNILKSFNKTGLIVHLNNAVPQYREFTQDDVVGSVGFDYHAACNIVRQAQEGFQALPAQLRKVFHNDPAEFVAFVDDPANFDEAVKLGLVEPRKALPDEQSAAPRGAAGSPAGGPPAAKDAPPAAATGAADAAGGGKGSAA